MSEKAYDALLREFEGSAWELYRKTGIALPIAGGAGPGPTGYNETADILTRTVDGTPFADLYNEIITTLELINAQRSPLIERLVFPVTDPFEQVMPITEHDFEEADEYGQPVGIRLGVPWNLGFDLRYFDLGTRYTFRFLGRARDNQIRAINNTAIEADRRLVATKVLTQLFTVSNRAATLEDTGTPVTVYPLYNGSTTALPVAPPTWKTFSHATTHEHHLASGAAAVVPGDLDDMYDHIYHHGYAQDSEIFLLVNKVEAQLIKQFRVGTASALYDFIPRIGSADAVFRGFLTGSLPGAAAGGLDTFPGFIGTYGPVNVIQEDYIPAGWMVMFASGGRYNLGNLIGLREHENEELRGLKLIPQFDRYPLREAFYHHALGAGVRLPGAGVVMKVTAGAYTEPSLSISGPGGR